MFGTAGIRIVRGRRVGGLTTTASPPARRELLQVDGRPLARVPVTPPLLDR